MTQNEMIGNLAGKCNVSPEEARAALETGEWNMLTAAQLLEVGKLRRAQQIEEVVSDCGTATAAAAADGPAPDAPTESTEAVGPGDTAAKDECAEAGKHRGGMGLKNLGDAIRRLVACGNRNRFVVRRNGAASLELPVTVVAVLMLFAFWTCVPLLVIGLFLGCRYSFSGPDLGREGINGALDRAAGAAGQLKGSISKA